MKKSDVLKLIEGKSKLKVLDNEPLEGNEIAPPLTKGNEVTYQGHILDKDGNPHINVGIKSNYNFIRSFETKEELPQGHLIHWCHPSRFEIVE